MSKIFNNALLEAKERESAVSPVVGVMLMLVVTIIIAATVSAFAGGLVGTSDKAPQAAFDTKITAIHGDYGEERTMVITHLGGDPIDTARIKVTTSWTNRTTNEINYRETTALPVSETPFEWTDWHGVDHSINLDVANANVNYSSTRYQEPYFVVPGVMPSEDGGFWFGNFILHPGEVMKVHSSTSYWNSNGYADHSVIKNSLLLSNKDSVNVKLIDIPTGNIIYNQDVYVTETTGNM